LEDKKNTGVGSGRWGWEKLGFNERTSHALLEEKETKCQKKEGMKVPKEKVNCPTNLSNKNRVHLNGGGE